MLLKNKNEYDISPIVGEQAPPKVGKFTYKKTTLDFSDELQFRKWYSDIAKELGLNPDPDESQHYYDYRGYWKAYGENKEGMAIDPYDKKWHFPDEFKLFGHPTLEQAPPEKEYNSLGELLSKSIEITTEPKKEPSWWDKLWEKTKSFGEWLFPKGIQDLPRQYGAAIEKGGMAAGEAMTWLVRLLPGNENLKPYAEQDTARQAWTVAQAGAAIGAVTTAVSMGIDTIKGLKTYLKGTELQKGYKEVPYTKEMIAKGEAPKIRPTPVYKAGTLKGKPIPGAKASTLRPGIEITRVVKPAKPEIATAALKQLSQKVQVVEMVKKADIIDDFTLAIKQALITKTAGTPATQVAINNAAQTIVNDTTAIIPAQFSGEFAVGIINEAISKLDLAANVLSTGMEYTKPKAGIIAEEEKLVEKELAKPLEEPSPYGEKFVAPEQAEILKETVDSLPRFAPLEEATKQMGLTTIPSVDSPEYIKYWKSLDESQQKLELQRVNFSKDVQGAFTGKPEIAPKAEMERVASEAEEASMREDYIFEQIEAGKTEIEIAKTLNITPKTVGEIYRAGVGGGVEEVADVDYPELAGKPEIAPKAEVITDIKSSLESRNIKGDNLLNNLDLAEELMDKNAEITPEGFVTLYHRTNEKNAREIIRTNKMISKEDRLFFGTQPTGQIEGYGDTAIRVRLPIEKLELSDMFANEAHVTIKSGRVGTPISMEAELIKPEIAPKAEIERVVPISKAPIIPPTKPPIVPPIVPPRLPPSDIPKTPGEPEGDPIDKLNGLIKQAKPLRKEIEKIYTEERGKRIGEVEKFIEMTIDGVGGEEGYKIILSKLKGELISPEAKPRFEPVKEKLTEADLKSLYLKIWKHPYLDSWEKISVADGFTNLLMGAIPQPKKLALLEEVYGSELIKNILSKRVWGAKATDLVIELLNVPRALLATADMSAFLRQGVVEIPAHPVISAKAIGKTFEFAFKPESFEQYFADLKEDELYPLMRKSGLAITDPRKAGMVEREEAFISRFLQKIPILKIPVTFAERSYVGFLNKLRVDVFKLWANELLAQGLSPEKNKDVFKSAADIVNTFTGRGSLGEAGNKIAPQLNTIFFSPRLISARFNALNPVWYAKQPPEIRKKAIGDFAKFVAAGVTTLALIKLAAGDKIDVELDPRSSDFGKIRIGNTRFDIWGGFQQWARVFAQITMGERKSTTTGRIISLNKDEYPFTTRKEVLLRFIEGKLAPVPALINELASGAKTFTGEDMTLKSVAFQKFIPMYIQDIAEAYADGGLAIGVGTGTAAFFGVGAQTWGGKKWEWKPGKKLPWEKSPTSCSYHLP